MADQGSADGIFLDGVPADLVLARLAAAGGNEVESGKLASPESSAALAVNAFGWFMERPELLPPLPGCPMSEGAVSVTVEYCARFPWSGGRHPWLDAAIETSTHLIGVESKRFEPFRDKKTASLSAAYDRPVWGEGMRQFEAMRDELRKPTARFQLLDAAQLVKHAFGLVTDARRKSKRAHLHYIYAEPRLRNGTAISDDKLRQHRDEIVSFSDSVAGAEVGFSACSYVDWIDTWRNDGLANHGENLVRAFAL